ncbi:radical SAM/SPASM domain-containing protein [Aestuariirhabdus litorea]|uniref:Radical SAM protein n=1 Tax=Aestuariirhabdus litorea TaxID=2528527 RepID=A0A3P3VQY7_9GAMM|nr:radical SAM protein [Aestuariirhabdus litorea]RRJ85040.1 radical SAM protein [Aestuariirhabdus litorea]RWW98265.1 radical SAM protein [Endozoicomonadaceae bacterium GTF-13]
MSRLSMIAINLTDRCNLACEHCYLDARTLRDGSPHELSTAEVKQLLSEIASRGTETMVVLTGGEPLLRRDIEELVAHGHERKLFMVLGSNGTLLSEQRIRSLKAAGLMGVGISLDSIDPDWHDRFRGKPGAWLQTVTAMEQCRQQGLSFQVHFSVHAGNAHELEAMVEAAHAQGARVFNLFFLVCTGRGERVTDISPQQYERVLQQALALQEHYPDMLIRPRCAPHYKRVAHQLHPEAPINRISGNEGDGCIAGSGYCRITPQGGVTPCPYIADEVGNIREQGFLELWDQAPVFEALRHPRLEGKCGQCEYQQLCGGCRARPLAAGDGLMGEDPLCAYQPQGGELIFPLQEQPLLWHPLAEQRLSRVPGFIRAMVRKRAEAYAREQGDSEVTTTHLEELTARRFGANPPFKPDPGR